MAWIFVDYFPIWKLNFICFYFLFNLQGISLSCEWEMSAAILYLTVETIYIAYNIFDYKETFYRKKKKTTLSFVYLTQNKDSFY